MEMVAVEVEEDVGMGAGWEEECAVMERGRVATDMLSMLRCYTVMQSC